MILALIATAGTAGAQTASGTMTCTAPPDALHFKVDLPNTARAIRLDKELVIVAIGSSSTEGVGASSQENSYPARLARELKQRWPRLRLKVINEGIGGETARQMLLRFETDVLAHKPQLVIWQAGSNALLTKRKLEDYIRTIRTGVRRLKAAKTDVILMDPQFSPVVVAQPAHQRMIAAMRTIANDLKVGLFQRFTIMRHWVARGGQNVDDVVSRDRLHMNDASYGCIARLLADSVSVVARRNFGPVSVVIMQSSNLSEAANRFARQAHAFTENAAQFAKAARQAESAPFLFLFTVFALSCFIGFYVVWSVTPALHSPLMSVTNAISSVVIVGGLIAVGPAGMDFSKVMGFFAVTLAAINIFGGFIVTNRMLSMFKKKK